MPRKPRFFVPGVPVHIVQRGNNRQAIFFEEADYEVYLSFLLEALDLHGCEVHAYVLMTSHTHILATPRAKVSPSRMMQYVGRYYVPYVNQKYGRSGTLWEGRFKAAMVETSSYLLACYRYIELNPVRAHMVRHPADYRWSSYRCNGLQARDGLITQHAEYRNLGLTDKERAERYQKLFELTPPDVELDALRLHTQSGTPLGSEKFREQIEAALAMKTGHLKPGRPRHKDD